MKLSRRGALTAAVGGVAAAPSMAKEAIAKLSLPTPTYDWANTTKGYPSDCDASPAKPPQSLIDEARRLARGDVPDEVLDGRCGIPIADPVNDLRSLSPAAKRYISARHYRAREKAKIIERAKQAIEEYDKTGWLKHIW
jgi:hypothetical protein